MNFERRAQLTELMDEACSYAEFRDCLRDLMRVNRTVLTYRPTLQWLEQFWDKSAEPLHIVDVGCGAGDMLRRIEQIARKRKAAVRLTGLDRNPFAAKAAREFGKLHGNHDSEIEWVTCDMNAYQPAAKVDLVISSLFAHHLANSAIIEFLQWMERVADRGWFINDLSRGRVPYYTFILLSNAMRWHRFVRHDGPVSVRRSFSTADWNAYVSAAGLSTRGLNIYSKWPGRLCVSRVKPPVEQ